MKEYQSAHIRNLAVVGHGKSGKTSLCEAFLYDSGFNKRLGKVDDGSSSIDYEAEEIKRKMSISLVLASCEFAGFKLNFLDTPGYPDFVGEVKSALRAAESALVVVSAPSGVEVETEKVWQYAEEAKLPRIIFINKMDREHANFNAAVEELQTKFGHGAVPIQLPIGSESTFQGVIDLLTMRTKLKIRDEVRQLDIPEFMQEQVDEARQKLIETVADYNNELMEKYLEGEEISEVEVQAALIEGINDGKIFPILCGSAIKDIGAKKLMEAIIEYMPTPYFNVSVGTVPDTEEIVERTTEDEFSAIVFKTAVDPFIGRLSYLKVLSGELKDDTAMYNPRSDKTERVTTLCVTQGKAQTSVKKIAAGDIVLIPKLLATRTNDTLCLKENPIVYEGITYPEPMLDMAVKAKNKGDEDKIGTALAKIREEDMTLRLENNKATKENVLFAIGELQIDILKDKIKRKFGVDIELKKPAVPYRETIRKSAKAEGKHKKQSGGHGQYGHVWLEISPLEPGSDVEFTETIFGGAVPRQYIPAVEKGARETLQAGIFAGYPAVAVKVNLYDGSYHTVDSSEAAFKTAAALALKKAFADASPVLLEPIYNVKIKVPEYYTGDVIATINSRRGRIMGMNSAGKDMSLVEAQLPLGEMYKYATELRSVSQGRGSFTKEFSHYEEAPQKVSEALVNERK
jgi:elongation factor G